MLSFYTVTETIRGSLIVRDFHLLSTHIFIKLHFRLNIAIQNGECYFQDALFNSLKCIWSGGP